MSFFDFLMMLFCFYVGYQYGFNEMKLKAIDLRIKANKEDKT